MITKLIYFIHQLHTELTNPLDKAGILIGFVSMTDMIDGTMKFFTMLTSIATVSLGIYIKFKNFQLKNEKEKSELLQKQNENKPPSSKKRRE